MAQRKRMIDPVVLQRFLRKQVMGAVGSRWRAGGFTPKEEVREELELAQAAGSPRLAAQFEGTNPLAWDWLAGTD